MAEILLQLQDNLTVNPRSRRYTTRTVTGAADSLAESSYVVGSTFSRRTRRLEWRLGSLINVALSAAALHVTGNTLAAGLVAKAAIAQAPGRRTASTSDSLTDTCGHGNVDSSNKTPAGGNDYDWFTPSSHRRTNFLSATFVRSFGNRQTWVAWRTSSIEQQCAGLTDRPGRHVYNLASCLCIVMAPRAFPHRRRSLFFRYQGLGLAGQL